MTPAIAFAQDGDNQEVKAALDDTCYSLDQNDKWSVLFSEFAEAYSLGDYATALDKTASLKEICVRSPLLNFSIAQTYNQLGDKQAALNYIKDATHYTQEFNVSDDVAKRMWEFRYTLEHADEFNQKELEIANANKALEASNLRVKELSDEIDSLHYNANSRMGFTRDNAKQVWIAGAIVGGIGVAAIGAGAGIISYAYGSGVPVELKSNNKAEVKWPLTVGWSVFGIGLGMTVAGAVMAGIGGYQYTHSDDNVAFSVGVSPASLDFSMQF
ncbi:MAG: hypothetical protein J6A01_08180 [Proteobacteria bacterium]|nr:hypothetical protein [Pseudomonadota bacterium]